MRTLPMEQCRCVALAMAVALGCLLPGPARGAETALAEKVKAAHGSLGGFQGGGKSVYFRSASSLTEEAWKLIESIDNLKAFTCNDGKEFGDAQLQRLCKIKSLEYIFVNGATMTDAGFAALAGPPRLRYFGLNHSFKFSGVGLAPLKNCTNLVTLVFGGAAFDDDGLEVVAEFTHLQGLVVGGTRVTSAAFPCLARLVNLRKLSFSSGYYPHFIAADFVHLAPLVHLEDLTIGRMVLPYDDGLAHLKRLKALKHLKMDTCGVTATDLERLKADLPNVKIEWTPMPAPDQQIKGWNQGMQRRKEALPEAVAGRLLERLLPGRSPQFVFETIPRQDGRDVFELDSRDGKIVVRGNSASSLAFGLNWYLKYYGHCNVSVNGRQLNLPDPPPAVDKKFRLAGWAKARYLLNYVTFGYVSPWWDWPQWEKSIDWMALNGVNMPLAVTGQEGVWQAVCRKFGMSDAEIEAFLPGPPYLPFCWMGCLDGHGGPLPKDWIARHVDLGGRILARERELGMTPVLQGFTGHIPAALAEKFPGTKVQRIRWSEHSTCMLDPQDPLFLKIAAEFLQEQKTLFGSDHLYDADSFIEMAPPSGDLEYLARISRAIYDGMAKTDPKAVWLLQSWTFQFQPWFWKQDRIKAFLNAVPDDRLLVLDLFCENTPVWNTTQGFYGKPWVWSIVYNFGDRSMLGGLGPLDRVSDLPAARKHPLGGKLRGVGMLTEGFGHNPLVSELLYELAWRDDVDLAAWVREYPHFRYGRKSAAAEAAWQTLLTGVYDVHGLYDDKNHGQTIVTTFPAAGRKYQKYSTQALVKAWRLLLQAENELGGTETWRHDVVNVARQALSAQAGQLYDRTMAAYDAKDLAAYRRASREFLQLIGDLDTLLATNDEFLLGAWLEDARRWGRTNAERVGLEWNARRILTLWGTGTALRDYAWKEWSGMLSGFYAKRWELFFQRQMEALEGNKPFDQRACEAELRELEERWDRGTERYPSKPAGDSVKVARRLLEKYSPPAGNAGLSVVVAPSKAAFDEQKTSKLHPDCHRESTRLK